MTDREQLKHDTYLGIAKNISELSRDKNTQVGAVIVAGDGSSVSWGYNGTIPGFPDDEIPHSRELQELEYIEDGVVHAFSANKYPFMEHAEANAIDAGDPIKMRGSTIYVTHMPCSSCARKIAKHGIKTVCVADHSTAINSSVGADDDITKFIFNTADIHLYVGGKQIHLHTGTKI